MDKDYIKCENCGFVFRKGLDKCPLCGEEQGLSKHFYIVLAIVVVICIIFYTVFYYYDDIFIKPDNSRQYTVNIPIRPLGELSGLSKDEIFSLRKKYVANSVVFSNNKKYTPNPDVYQIEDNLPWISAEQIVKYGTQNNSNIGKGSSRCSVSVNNPDIPITIIIPEYRRINNDISLEELYYLPKKAEYNKKRNIITVHFYIQRVMHKLGFNYLNMYLDETNARDMGYEWIYANRYEDLKFFDNSKITKEPIKMLGYYHKGYSCGLESGCNNYSPQQDNMSFYKYRGSGYIEFKLWKKKPLHYLQPADLTYKMVFD